MLLHCHDMRMVLAVFLEIIVCGGWTKLSARYVTLTFLHDDEWQMVNCIRARKQVVI
jgi:hypothetical protein